MKRKHFIAVLSFLSMLVSGMFLEEQKLNFIFWIFSISFVIFVLNLYFGIFKGRKWFNKTIVLLLLPILSNAQMVQDTLTIKDYLFEGLSTPMLYSAYIFAGLGLLFRWALNARKGIKHNINSPDKFDFIYWFKNNFLRALSGIVLTVIALFVLFRFTGEIINMPLTMSIAFMGGLGIDWLIKKVSKFRLK